MAFAAAGLTSPVHGVGRNRIHHYTTADAHATVAASGYFNDATRELVQGDVIIASTAMGGTPALRIYIVTSATEAATVTTDQVANA